MACHVTISIIIWLVGLSLHSPCFGGNPSAAATVVVVYFILFYFFKAGPDLTQSVEIHFIDIFYALSFVHH